jgi:hypothetical protein
MNTDGWIVDEKVTPNAQLRQGDLIAFQTEDKLRKYGVVVTADCDLENKKHARLITVVPIVELVDVVECYLLLERCERSRANISSFVIKAFSLSGGLSLPEELDELRQILLERSTDPTAATMCLAARILLHEVDRLSVGEFHAVCTAAGLRAGKLDEQLAQQIQQKGDILILPTLKSLGISADIAWVRQVWQVALKDIVFRTSEVREGRGQRVARLDSPYRYRLTQLMSQVFSDIGLPNSTRNIPTELGQVLQ